MNITLSPEIYQKLSARVQSSQEFASVDDYVNYVLGEVVKQIEPSPVTTNATPYSKKQEETVKKRLEDLGYLD